jgi:hypothetical protein
MRRARGAVSQESSSFTAPRVRMSWEKLWTRAAPVSRRQGSRLGRVWRRYTWMLSYIVQRKREAIRNR